MNGPFNGHTDCIRPQTLWACLTMNGPSRPNKVMNLLDLVQNRTIPQTFKNIYEINNNKS